MPTMLFSTREDQKEEKTNLISGEPVADGTLLLFGRVVRLRRGAL